MPDLSLNLLGPFQATLDDRPLVKFRTSKVQALLIYLAVETVDTPNLAHRREALMELLWPGLPVRSAQDNLRQTLYLLRKTIPHVRAKEGGESLPFVLTDRQTARLNPACAYALDLATFRQLLDGQPTPSKLEKACALYRGEFLADFFLPDSAPFEDWAAHGRAELQRQVLDALETLTEHQITVGNYDQAQSFSWRALEIDDLRENAHRGLMTALAAAGQRTNALAQYQICQKRLGDELGVEPSTETTALYEQIQADALREAGASRAPPVPPRRGLPVFLFTDIEGSTPLWETHRAAMLPALLTHNRILEEQIARHGGRILELRGDGVKAVFEGGDPLLCVLAIQRAFGRQDWGAVGEIRIRIGLHCVRPEQEGLTFFFRGDQYYGPALHHAARVMDAGHGGQILVSEIVRNAFPLPPSAAWQEFGEHALKGVEGMHAIFGLLHPDLPLQTFPPLRTVSTAPDPISLPQEHPFAEPVETNQELPLDRATVFVSRERELAQLDRLLKKALTGRGQMAFVIGEAGRGKTSLLHAFARRAQAAQPGLIVASGICDDYTGVGDPYLPFRDVLKMLSGDVETQWAAGDISRDHAVRLWHLLPRTARALVKHGPDLIGSFIPGELLIQRVAAYQRHGVAKGENSAWLDRLQALAGQRQGPTEGYGPDQQRVFEAYAAVLESLATGGPLLLLLDDLHWADLSSIGLMSHLGRRIASAASPILIVGAYRPEEMAQDRPWSSVEGRGQAPLEMVLSELKRHFGDIWIDLEQAEPSGGRSFVDALLDSEPNRLGEGFRRELARHTQGQPLFTIELLQELRERGDLQRDSQGYWEAAPRLDWDVLPPRVEGVIEKRLGRLDPGLAEALTVASVEGEAFTAEAVARVLDLDPSTLVRRLSGELVKRHRLLEAQGMQRLGAQRLSRYRFRHNLFQKYLYDSLDEVERAYWHEAVGKALQTLYGDQVDEIAVQLARHFQEADIPTLAVDYLRRAGERAMRLAANEEAVEHLRQGLAVLEALPRSVEQRQVQLELELTLGQAERNAGRIVEALETFQRSADIARELGSAQGLARAALGYEELRWRFNLPTEPSAHVLADALAALGEEESVLRVRVWVNLVRTLMPTSSPEQFAAMSRQALEMARRVDDPLALYDALYLKLIGERRPEESEERFGAINEMLRLAPSLNDRYVAIEAYAHRILENLELGEPQSWQEDYQEAVRLSEMLRQPFYDYWPILFEMTLALLVGRFGEAERIAQQALEVGQQLGVENTDGIFGIQMFTIRREQGRLRELAPVVKMLVEEDSANATWRPGLALLYSELNLWSETREVFEDLAINGFSDLPRDAVWLTCIVYLAEVCAFLGDADRAAMLYQLLLPYAGRNVVVGFFTVCYGAAARFLGLLATTMSLWTEAEGHFEAALEMNAKLGARPWLAHTQHQYAAMLLTRDQPGDRDRAMSLLEEALGTARELGMASLIEKIEELER